MSSYHDIEAEHPRLKWSRLVHGFQVHSAAWYRRWRELHLERYPHVGDTIRQNLDMFIDMAEKRDAA